MSDNLADAIARLNQTGAIDQLASTMATIIAAENAKTQPSRRERIATAALAGALAHGSSGTCEMNHGCILFRKNLDAVEVAISCADKLIAALDGTVSAIDVLSRVLPYAESRAEDLGEIAAEPTNTAPCEHETESPQASAAKAWKAVEDAKALLHAAGRLP